MLRIYVDKFNVSTAHSRRNEIGSSHYSVGNRRIFGTVKSVGSLYHDYA